MPAHSVAQSPLELLRDRLKGSNVLCDNLKGAPDAVVIRRSLIPHLQPLFAALKSMLTVVLAVVSFLDFVHLNSLKDRFWSRH
jgi:hypothetical protein